MRICLFLTAFLFISMSSCKPTKAIDFKESLDRAERRAFEIIAGKEGSEEKNLKYLEKDDFKNALIAVNQQAVEFDKLIADIRKLSTNGISEGESLKTASIEYYQALKELHAFDKKEISQQALLQTLKNDELKEAQDKLIDLARQKKHFYNAVYEKEALLHSATQRFEATNGF